MLHMSGSLALALQAGRMRANVVEGGIVRQFSRLMEPTVTLQRVLLHTGGNVKTSLDRHHTTVVTRG